jgi:hypothetical protein
MLKLDKNKKKTTLKLIHKWNTYASCIDGVFEGFSFWKNYNIK